MSILTWWFAIGRKSISVRYEAVNAMLLNEFLKEHQKVQDQQSLIAQQGRIASDGRTTSKSKLKRLQKVYRK